MNSKKITAEILNNLGKKNLIFETCYELNNGNVIIIKYSKLSPKNQVFWYTFTEKNRIDYLRNKIDKIVLITEERGYYNIPFSILNALFDNYSLHRTRTDVFHLFLTEEGVLFEKKSNSVDVSSFFYKSSLNVLKFAPGEEKKQSISDMNYFSFKASISRKIYDDIQNKDIDIMFEGINSYETETRIGDFIFLTMGGDKPKWPTGLFCIGKVIKKPYDKGYDKKKPKNFRIRFEPLIILPNSIKKIDLIDYRGCFDIANIGPMTQGERNQVNTKLSENQAINIVSALRDIFPACRLELDKVFGEEFGIISNEAKSELSMDFVLKNSTPFNRVINQPNNLILYGAPGTGKSFELNKRVNEFFPYKELNTRITFHPNFSYRDFFGSYKPKPIYKEVESLKIFNSDKISEHKYKMEPLIEYVFEPGAFLKLLIKSLLNPNHNFVLIIEEINRANAASVFGDIFQLLDRKQNGPDVFWSEYSISLDSSVQEFLKSINNASLNTETLRIPSNLFIWATMNNADQGIQPMDSAFKRRWSFEYIGIDQNSNSIDDAIIELSFCSFPISWNKFRKAINGKLESIGIQEDKFIGPFFLTRAEMKDNTSIKNKLLLYLKEDVLKYKNGLFLNDLGSFSSILKRYDENANVFSDDISFE